MLACQKAPDGTRSIEERAHDFQMCWPTAVAMLSDDTALVADSQGNLQVQAVRSDAATDDERIRLAVAGTICCGENVNRFRKGELVMRAPDSELGDVSCTLAGCISGALLMVVSLPPSVFHSLWRLQRVMAEIPGVGNLHHAPWRQAKVSGEG